MSAKPTSLPPQRQNQQPGLEAEMAPPPEYIRPGYRGSGKLAGKVALITGGDSGIGRAVAVHFAREGADVAIVYKQEEQGDANETERLVQAEGRRCVQLPGDLRDERFCAEVVRLTIKELGRLNVLVSNATEQFASPDVAELSNEQFRDTFAVNFFPLVHLVKAAVPHLRAGDCILATSSVNAYCGNQQLVDYSTTKGNITAYIRSIAQQLAEQNIRVNSVAPGPIWTPLIPASFPPAKVEKFGQDTLLKRPSQPSEVAPVYVFLASDDASYITGQAIHPDGGLALTT